MSTRKNWAVILFLFTVRQEALYAGGVVRENGGSKADMSHHPIFILISYDGFRYDYSRKYHTPNIDLLRASGVSPPYLLNQFPTKTFPNHESLVTGLYVESHGVVEQTFFDPILNQTLGVDDEAFWKYNPDVLPIWVKTNALSPIIISHNQ